MKTIVEWALATVETACRAGIYANYCEEALKDAVKAHEAGDICAAKVANSMATYWSTRAFNEASQHDVERLRFVVRIAEGCERFLSRAAEAEDRGSAAQAADWRELAAAMSADAFEAMTQSHGKESSL